MKNIKLLKSLLISTLGITSFGSLVSITSCGSTNNVDPSVDPVPNEQPTHYDFLTYELNEDGQSYTVNDIWDDSKYIDEEICQEITIPSIHPTDGKSITAIGDGFLQKCTSLNSSITIPETIQTIGTNFMWNCNNFTKILTVSCPVNNFAGFAFTCATDDKNASCYQYWITVAGQYAQDFTEKFENSDRYSPYRKLILKTNK